MLPIGMLQTAQEATRNDKITVTNASQTICDARTSTSEPRLVITIRNISDDPTKIVTINLGAQQAIDNEGIILRQYESCTDSADGQYKPFQGTITAICAVASATPTITIMER